MTAAEQLKIVERALSHALAELATTKASLREWEQQSGRWKVGFEAMRGQVIAQTQCENSLRRADPETWEAHFSKRAKKERKLSGLQPHNFTPAEMPSRPGLCA